MFVLALLVVGALLTNTISYQVDNTEYALIKTFGQTTRQIDGRQDAGLKFKWPWPVQKLVEYDARTSVFEDMANEVPTRDKQNVLMTMGCVWRIKDPSTFNSTVNTPEAAQDTLRKLVRSAKSDVVAKHSMDEMINTDPAKMQLPRIEAEILDSVRQAADRYGIEVQNIGIKSLVLPKDVSATVIEAMKEERQRDVKKFESAGQAQATAITERAKAASDQILEFARRKAAEIESEGVQAAAKHYQEFAKNERFSMFLRSLESLKKELESKTVILLDGSQLPAVDFFRNGPSLKPFDNAPSLPAGTEKSDNSAAATAKESKSK
jgi:regulator of protease activity HflC (stomatin/prohibitin superfamily)